MPKTITTQLPAEGEALYDAEEKVFEDIKAQPGERRSYSFTRCRTKARLPCQPAGPRPGWCERA